MPLEPSDAERLASDLWVEWRDNREKSLEWQAWALGKQELPVIPDTATNEYRALQEKAITPWLGLIVQALAQVLIVDGYRSSGSEENSLLWDVWQANDMDAKQVSVYEAAFTTGISHVAVLPVQNAGGSVRRQVPKIEGVPVPEWRPYSSSQMTSFFESPGDDWPVYALAAEPEPKWRRRSSVETPRWRLTLFDDDSVYLFSQSETHEPVLEDSRPHGLGVTPVVPFVNRQTIEGRALGEVEPYIALASRIDQDVFDRLIVQRFGSWRVIWATGLAQPKTDAEKKMQDLMLRVGDILTSDSPDTKFGALAGTPLDGHLRAPIDDVRALSAVSQTPPTMLTGDLSNISAEALAAIESAFNRKAAQRKVTFGEAHERCFALSAQILRTTPDPSAEVTWADLESRSLVQVADAFGKLAQMLEIPVEVLWDKLGLLTNQEVERAKSLRSQGDGMEALLRELTQGQTSPDLEDVSSPNGA